MRRLEATQGLVVSGLLFAMMAITFVDVVGRTLFAAPLPSAYEITVLLLGATVYVATPLTTLREEHVAVSLLSRVIRGRAKLIQLALVNSLGAAVMGLLAWRLWLQGHKLAEMGNRMLFVDLSMAPVIYLMSAMALMAAAFHLLMAARCVVGRTAQSGGSGN